MNASWHRFVGVFALGFLALLALEALLRPHPGERNYEAFTEMVYSAANETMSRSSALPGRMTQQPLVAGVVVRGATPFHYGSGPEEAVRAGRELTNPFADDAGARARGAEVYGIFCVVCHAGDGSGQGSVVQRGMLPPPSMQGARALAMTDGEMFHVLTMGQGNMASYAAQVSADDRWSVILHVRTLQEEAR
jgi:mono/diheme cytochrome c family protein